MQSILLIKIIHLRCIYYLSRGGWGHGQITNVVLVEALGGGLHHPQRPGCLRHELLLGDGARLQLELGQLQPRPVTVLQHAAPGSGGVT